MRAQEDDLGADLRARLEPTLGPGLERAQHVLLDAGRRLVRDLERGLEQNRREFRVGLRREPTPEVLVWLEALDLFLKQWDPTDHQVEVLQANPIAILRGLLDDPDRIVVLPASHGDLAEAHARAEVLRVLLGELLQLRGRIGAGRGDEQNGQLAVRLVAVQPLEAQRRRGHGAHAHGLASELRQGRLQPVGAECLHEEHTLESGQA
mmetsp:Transcript_1612/g.4763  ORF Transcript_1612/g.4763 Transcript_1612/m.4763 type:complete len:207 (-) Transcript_1612:69-689(-)